MGRLRRTVRISSLINPDELFTKLPPALARRCRRAFEQQRRDALEMLAAQGFEDPGEMKPAVEPPPMPGQPGYDENWRRWYRQHYAGGAQRAARRQLEAMQHPQTESHTKTG